MRELIRVDDAPLQAWAVRLKDGRLSAVAGRGVRAGTDWLYEGAWAQTKHPRRLSLQGLYFGSGAVWDGKQLSLITPSHSADAVYAIQRPDALYASNSLPFVLVAAGIPDFPIASISQRVLSLKHGFLKYERLLAAGSFGSLYRYLNAVVSVGADGKLVEQQQAAEVTFRSFKEYRAYLISVLRQACRTYRGVGTAVYVSRGYDSVACAALAKRLGGSSVAISVHHARDGSLDDGSEIAAALGIRSVLVERRHRDKVTKDPRRPKERITEAEYDHLAEFYAGIGVVDECLRAPDELLHERVVLTGFHGDKIWDRYESPKPDLVRGDTSGSSLGEFRLRVGFVHVPVPMIGFAGAERLHAIANGSRMQPWQIGNRYDRPIPRRIAEAEGVPRELFGQRKQAAGTLTIDPENLGQDLLARLIPRYARASELLDQSRWQLTVAMRAGRIVRAGNRLRAKLFGQPSSVKLQAR
jgi:hypothetical protein